MKNLHKLIVLLSILAASGCTMQKEPVDYADPFMGTSSSRWMQFPGATLPFGMVQLSPDNENNSDERGSGYEYTFSSIHGFSHLHSWIMAGLSVMPTVGSIIQPTIRQPTSTNRGGLISVIDKTTEKASPGYYAVDLLNFGIKTELTSTTRCGFFRFTFPESDKASVYFNLKLPAEYPVKVLDARITMISDTEIEGYSKQTITYSKLNNEYTLHFVVRFNKPLKAFGGWEKPVTNRVALLDIKNNVSNLQGKDDVGAYISFETKQGEVILLQTAISFVSIDQARLNMETELKPFGWDFDAVRNNARTVWNNLLSKIEVQGGTELNKKKFYTNLYHCYVSRTIMSDVNGEYVDPCEIVRKLDDPQSPMLGSDAFWTTFWNLNQLWQLVNPDIANKWVKSELQMYKDAGWLSRGPGGIEYSGVMVASHEIPLIVSAYQKGIRNFNVNLAYEAILHQQTVQGILHPCSGWAGNEQLNTYIKLGYMPIDSGRASNTLEYAYDDWCVAQLAKALGKTEDYETFIKRAHNYQNMFDPETKYMRPKHLDGKWLEDFDPLKSPGYVEGNAWQYTFFVPHDLKGLISLIGKEEFNQRLNEGFEKSWERRFISVPGRDPDSYVYHGNQPNMQAAWLFNYSGKPWLTQKWVREIQDRFYGSDPYNAWLDDEDEGQMGAWFVMSALGLFEMDGGTSVKPIYEIGSPIFKKIIIHLDPAFYPGKTFTIEAKNLSDNNRYIQSAELNGKNLTKPWFYHSELVKGGMLTLTMAGKPNMEWGSAPEDAPPCMSDTDQQKF